MLRENLFQRVGGDVENARFGFMTWFNEANEQASKNCDLARKFLEA